MINGMIRRASVMVSIIIQTISTGTVGLPFELMRDLAPEDALNYSISSPSSNTTSATATLSSSSSSSSRLPFLPSPDYLVRLRRNNRTSLFYAYFHSVELEEGEGTNLTLNPLPLRRESGDGAYQPSKEYDDKGAMYFAIVVILLYGISIALLIASTVRGSRTDDELKTFMRSFAEVNRAKWREDKQKVHRLLQLHDPQGPQGPQGPMAILSEAQIDPSSILLRPCNSSNQDDLGFDDETDPRRCEVNPNAMVSRCISDQPLCETVLLYDSVPFVDE